MKMQQSIVVGKGFKSNSLRSIYKVFSMFYLFIQLNLILIIELEAEVKSRAYCISFFAKNPIICRDRTFLRNTQFSCGNVQALNFMESKLKYLLELSETLMPTICINFKKNLNIFLKKTPEC